jgi:hypothetical protein
MSCVVCTQFEEASDRDMERNRDSEKKCEIMASEIISRESMKRNDKRDEWRV